MSIYFKNTFSYYLQAFNMSLLIRTDVTAVKLHQNVIIAGTGSCACIYRKDNFDRLNKLPCLNGQKIYGFVPNENRNHIIAFGGKQFTVIFIEDPECDEGDAKVVRIIEPIQCDDWLHSAVWIDIIMIAVLTAHNTVQMWDISKQQMVRQHLNGQNSILYSGLLLPLQDDVLVFAGTVCSEIIIHTPNEGKALHHLKGHRGVIFSIAADLKKGIIVSTSDDRSVRIWCVNSTAAITTTESNTTDYWRNVSITCRHAVYGHTARVMRSCITDSLIISVGEDSVICYWDFEGKLLKKTITHQNGCIWSVDADKTDLVTGGGDCAVILHPLSTALIKSQNEIFSFDEAPKKIAFTSRRNLVILDDSDNLIHYDVNDKTQTVYRLQHKSTYKLLSISNCKQLIAVADMNGKLDIFAENCKDIACLTKLIDSRLELGKILSMHWAGNRHLVFCADQGVITVVSSRNVNLETYAVFILPPRKERWLTAAAIDSSNKTLVVGDRCGNVHIYLQGSKNPHKTFPKVHGRYGPTSITIRNNEIITTGRDGTVKYFCFYKNDITSTKYMSSKDLAFQWVEKFIDKNQNVVCGFQERAFIVYDIKIHSKLLEVPCGGGHRSWDVIRYVDKVEENCDEFVRFVYIKNSDIHSHIFRMSQIISRNVISSSHSKEINCLKTFDSKLDALMTFYVTGSEDTTLRVSSIDSELKFKDEAVFKHLSNVRALKIIEYNDGILVVSAGGRAQICIRFLKVTHNGVHLKISAQDLVDFLIKGTDKERKNNQTCRNSTIDFDPETRIMDLDLVKTDDNNIVIYVGCSDACLRTFYYAKESLQPMGEVRHHKTCILKTVCVKICNLDILITCTTRGEITLWNLSKTLEGEQIPFFTMTTHNSGINSIDSLMVSDKEILVAMGGDDNAVTLSLFEVPVPNVADTHLKCKWSTDKYHCSQVTGVKFVKEFLLSTSIDMRVTLSRWGVGDDGIRCEFLSQMYSDVADIQGMDILNSCRGSITLCVYGKGMEVLRVPTGGPP